MSFAKPHFQFGSQQATTSQKASCSPITLMKTLQLLLATMATAGHITMAQNETSNQAGTVSGAGSDYHAPFSTDAPSDLFERRDTLTTLAPIINVAADLLKRPLPTNAWWGNLIHTTPKDIDTVANPAWSNPFALKLPKQAPYGLQACYSYTYRNMAPEVNGAVKYYLHGFHNDITLSATEFASTKPNYKVYSFSDMGVSIRTCVSGSKSCMDSSLVNGMAFVSATYSGLIASINSEYQMTLLDSSTPGKYIIQLPNQQTWVVYSSDTSATFSIDSTGSALVASAAYTGTLRVAILPNKSDQNVYDAYSSCIIRGGNFVMNSRTSYSLQWETEGTGCDSTGLLHFALPHQVDFISGSTTTSIVLNSATRGQMVGQVTTSSSWSMTEDESTEEVDFYPANKPSPDTISQINLLSTLQKDINSDWSLSSGSWYFNGKAYQKYASLCLMAADSSVVGDDTTLLRTCLTKLEKLLEPFLNNKLGSPLVYDTAYKGIVTSQVFITNDVNVDFGNGIYNDHHYHYGYWVMASAIMKKLNPSWSGMAQLEVMIWTMLRDVANPSSNDAYFPRFRHFSWYLGHSYSHGVTPVADGKDEESTSEDINFSYGMMLWGKVTKNKAVEDLGSLMLRLNARAVRTYFLMTSDNKVHPPKFVSNHVTGIFFDNKVDYTTWFSPEKYCIHGIQMIPVSPINGIVRTSAFIQEEWTDILSKEAIVTSGDTSNPWLSLLLVNQAVINQAEALAKLATATMDDGLTRSWALYNAASRGGSKSSGSTTDVTVEPSPSQSAIQTDMAATLDSTTSVQTTTEATSEGISTDATAIPGTTTEFMTTDTPIVTLATPGATTTTTSDAATDYSTTDTPTVSMATADAPATTIDTTATPIATTDTITTDMVAHETIAAIPTETMANPIATDATSIATAPKPASEDKDCHRGA